jgi:carbon monoxide dehydrogenase subunit G
MDMTGERRIPAPRQKVWDALNDPAVLKACIPGCESLERLPDDSLKATAAIKIGPISARFAGKVQLLELDPPNGYRIEGEGAGGVAGFAKGGAAVRLADSGNETLMTYDVKAQVGGKIAQLGARLIDATAKQMADQFFNRFVDEVSGPSPIAADGPAGLAAKALETVTGDAGGSSAHAVTTPVAARPNKAGAAMGMLDLIPKEPFGLPRIFFVGCALFLVVLALLAKAYVVG